MARLTCTISLSGELDDRFFDSFDGLTLSTAEGRSLLSGSVTDQAELQGILRRLFELGLEVLSFQTDSPAKQGLVDDPHSPNKEPR